MIDLLTKFDRKLVAAGLAAPGAPLLGGLDDELVWNRDDPARDELARVFDRLAVNSLLCCRPADPFGPMLDFLAERALADAAVIGGDGQTGSFRPSDSETRTFLHELPVARDLTAEAVANTLARRKSLIVPGRGVVTAGAVSPEQAFVCFSSVCFAASVKFFLDYLQHRRAGTATEAETALFEAAWAALAAPDPEPPALRAGPFESEEDARAALCEVGRHTVERRLVDSFFGNVSYRVGDTLYISQTGSSLDELEHCIDPCSLDGGSCAGLTASSELTAHREALLGTGKQALLHGHPRFAVILSMDCDKDGCAHTGRCHLDCPTPRALGETPIVPGEVGTGPHGLCHTLPPALVRSPAAIVFGHGVFATGASDFRDAFAALLAVERFAHAEYRRRLDAC